VVDLKRLFDAERRLAVGALAGRQRPQRFLHLGAVEEAVVDVRPPLRTLLEWLRKERAATGAQLLGALRA
jgi:hypothetical protein